MWWLVLLFLNPEPGPAIISTDREPKEQKWVETEATDPESEPLFVIGGKTRWVKPE